MHYLCTIKGFFQYLLYFLLYTYLNRPEFQKTLTAKVDYTDFADFRPRNFISIIDLGKSLQVHFDIRIIRFGLV